MERRDPISPGLSDQRLRTYRIYAVIAGVLIVMFWVVYKLTDPSVVDPFVIRVALAILTFGALALSYRVDVVERRFVFVMQVLLYAYTVWFIGLLAANAFSPNYAIGLLFVIAAIAVAISTGLDRPHPLLYYLAFASGVTTVVVLLVERSAAGTVGRVIFIGLVYSIGLVIYVAARAAIRAQGQLAASEAKYHKLFSAANDAILVVDPISRRILEVNERAATLYGYSEEELVGMRVDDLSQGRRWIEGLSLGNVEVVHYRRDGMPIDLLVSTARIQYEGKIAILSIHHDMTERLKTIHELGEANRALLMRNRELRDFTTAASHDLQEPLRKIRTFADLLEGEHGLLLPAEGRTYLERIQDIAGHMSRLISDLLAFTFITAHPEPYRPLDLNTVVRKVLDDLAEPVHEAGMECEVGDLPSIEAAPTQVYRLFRHLLENAIKFRRTDAAARVAIEGQVEDSAENGAEVCRIDVVDNGIGFDEKYLGRIFSPFEQLDRHRSDGTGMGLAICKRIVERHGGSIQARSIPGEGSRFTIKLPVKQSDSDETGAYLP